MSEKFSGFFKVNPKYTDFLRDVDPCVPLNKGNKEARPFIGIIMTVNGIDYFAPLSSPKAKHLKMKDQIDFIKIEKGELGAINLNNMIPVAKADLTALDIRHYPSDTPEETQYKILLSKQLSWCDSNHSSITKKAKHLYKTFTNGMLYERIRSRCCNFTEDENLMRIWLSK